MDSSAYLIAGMGTLATVIGVLFKWGRDSTLARVAEYREMVAELKAAHAAELARRDEQEARQTESVRRLLVAIGRGREAAALGPKSPEVVT